MHIFYRTCNFSNISITKERPKWFDRELCFKNFLESRKFSHTDVVTVVFDGEIPSDHWLHKYFDKYKLLRKLELKSGSGGQSFADTIKYIVNEYKVDDTELIYLLEDDYLHMPHWDIQVLDAFMDFNPSYLTLYDHPDKYNMKMYPNLLGQVLWSHSSNKFWRTTPSTTDTFIARFGTLKEDLEILLKHSEGKPYSQDHQRFLELWQKGRTLISPLPSLSTHCESANLAHNIDWEVVARLYGFKDALKEKKINLLENRLEKLKNEDEKKAN